MRITSEYYSTVNVVMHGDKSHEYIGVAESITLDTPKKFSDGETVSQRRFALIETFGRDSGLIVDAGGRTLPARDSDNV